MQPKENGPNQTSCMPGVEPNPANFAATFVESPETSTGKGDTGGSQKRTRSEEVETWVAKTLGKYQVTGALGQGGMGFVLKAHDPLIERDVAIKVLASHLVASPQALARFLTEAKAVGKISHPNVIAIYEIFQEDETYYLVLEYAAKGSLGDLLASQGTMSVLAATRAVIDACQGIGAAHAAGLIHRDLKPANLMMSADGTVKVADFGLVKGTADTTRQFTQAGTIVGTPFFMSPEQCEARPLDGRSDLYSLGATYYSLLTGKHPYQETDSIPQLMYLHCHGETPDPRDIHAAIPVACSQIIARAMAKQPAQRYQTAAEMGADLEMVAATLSGQVSISLPSQQRFSAARSSEVVLAPATSSPARENVSPWLPLSRRAFLGGGAAIGGLAILGGGWNWWRQTGASPTASSGVLAPALTEPIKVGILHSLSGTMATSESVMVDAVLFGLEEINQAGGLLGRSVEAIVADGQSEANVFAEEARRLITVDHVCTIFGCWTSASRKAVRTVVEELDHLLVYPLQYEGLETSPSVVYLGAAPNQQILPALNWALRTLGKRRFFLVGSDYIFPRAANAILRDAIQEAGAEVVGEAYIPLGSNQVTSAVQAMGTSRPDTILNTINGDTNLEFFRALRATGISSDQVPTLSFSVGEQLSRLAPKLFEGDYTAWTYFETIDSPENRDFLARFRKLHPHKQMTDPMESAYLGVKLWAAAVTEAGSLDPRKICRALQTQRLKGPDGEVRIDAETQHTYRTPRIAQFQANGKDTIIWTADAPVRPEPYPKTRTAEEWKGFLSDLYQGWGDQWSAPVDKAVL